MAVLVGNSNNDIKYEQLNLEIMLEEQVSGLIVQFCSNRPKHYLELSRSDVPVVCVDHVPPGMPLDSVVTDNCQAMAHATRHLLALGHRRFALIGGPLDHDTAIERQRGFVLALQEAGLGQHDYVVENGEWQLDGFYMAAQRLLGRIQPPFALLTVNNDATTATLKAIRERQWRIPEDVAFIGFDEMPWTDAYNPPLTVVDQHPYHIGAVAAELLFSRMRNPSRPVQQAKLACELIVRQIVWCTTWNIAGAGSVVRAAAALGSRAYIMPIPTHPPRNASLGAAKLIAVLLLSLALTANCGGLLTGRHASSESVVPAVPPAPTPDAATRATIATVMAGTQPVTQTLTSPDGGWQAEIAMYGCVAAGSGGEADDEYAFEALFLTRAGTDMQAPVDSQLINCGGLSAYGFQGLCWSPDSR